MERIIALICLAAGILALFVTEWMRHRAFRKQPESVPNTHHLSTVGILTAFVFLLAALVTLSAASCY